MDITDDMMIAATKAFIAIDGKVRPSALRAALAAALAEARNQGLDARLEMADKLISRAQQNTPEHFSGWHEAARAEARNQALEEAATFVDAHADLERAGISDLSEASDPPLTKSAAQASNLEGSKKSAQAETYGIIAAAIRALKETAE